MFNDIDKATARGIVDVSRSRATVFRYRDGVYVDHQHDEPGIYEVVISGGLSCWTAPDVLARVLFDDEGRIEDIAGPMGALIAACRQIVNAYAAGARSGGSVDWSDIDDAHALARSALRPLDAMMRHRGAPTACSVCSAPLDHVGQPCGECES